MSPFQGLFNILTQVHFRFRQAQAVSRGWQRGCWMTCPRGIGGQDGSGRILRKTCTLATRRRRMPFRSPAQRVVVLAPYYFPGEAGEMDLGTGMAATLLRMLFRDVDCDSSGAVRRFARAMTHCAANMINVCDKCRQTRSGRFLEDSKSTENVPQNCLERLLKHLGIKITKELCHSSSVGVIFVIIQGEQGAEKASPP